MDTEAYFLKLLEKSGITYKINDDCAWLSPLLNHTKDINKNSYIIATDSFIEDIHFRTQNFNQGKESIDIKSTNIKRYVNKNQWLSYENLAKKAFLVNISDILSSGALPKYALLSIVLPKKIHHSNIKDIISGLVDICKTYNIKLIGGDTMCGDKLAFNITMIGNLIGKYISRNSIRNGDLLAYTSIRNGDLGTSLYALRMLLRYGAYKNVIPYNYIESNDRLSRFTLPFLRMQFLKRSYRLLHACMDISDGLANEISRLERQNKLTFYPFKILKKQVYQSGEEYELLFSFSKKHGNALKKIANATRTKIHIIGRFGRYKPQFFSAIKWHT